MGEDEGFYRFAVPAHSPAWVGPLSRRLDGMFAEESAEGMVDATDKPLPVIVVELPARLYDEFERIVCERSGGGCRGVARGREAALSRVQDAAVRGDVCADGAEGAGDQTMRRA